MMKPFAITAVAIVCALAVVLSTRLLIPAAILIFRAIEQSFEPDEPALALAAASPVVVTEAVPIAAAPAPKKAAARKTRARKTPTKVGI